MFYITQTLHRNVIRSIWALLLTATCFSAIAQIDKAELDSKKYERIEVKGKKTTAQLRNAFDKQRFEFLDLFNTYNEEAKYDMLCSWRRPVGSKIAKKSCEPRYLKDFRTIALRNSMGVGIDASRLLNEEHIHFLTKDQREEAFEHITAMVATHQELYDSFAKLYNLHERLEERKTQGKQDD